MCVRARARPAEWDQFRSAPYLSLGARNASDWNESDVLSRAPNRVAAWNRVRAPNLVRARAMPGRPEPARIYASACGWQDRRKLASLAMNPSGAPQMHTHIRPCRRWCIFQKRLPPPYSWWRTRSLSAGATLRPQRAPPTVRIHLSDDSLRLPPPPARSWRRTKTSVRRSGWGAPQEGRVGVINTHTRTTQIAAT